MKAIGKCILVVEDDPIIQRTLQRNLEVSGFEVLVTNNGQRAIELVRAEQPDLILLDLWLQGEVDGMEVCAQVRQWTQIPIIVVSARTEEKQKVEALDQGADDYLTKPFSTDELLARVRACLRRAANQEMESATQHEVLFTADGHLSMNLARRQVIVNGKEVKLTPTEYELLHQLMIHSGKVLTHRILLRSVWGPEYGEEADYLRVYVRQLRRKVELDSSHPHYILTEPGVGYVFHIPVQKGSVGSLPSSGIVESANNASY
jgi:two-component system, OmpR family, KDP operon response regulator KdpE